MDSCIRRCPMGFGCAGAVRRELARRVPWNGRGRIGSKSRGTALERALF